MKYIYLPTEQNEYDLYWVNFENMSSIVHIIDNKHFDEVHDSGVDLATQTKLDANGDAIDIKNGKSLSIGTSSDEENVSTCSSSKDDDEGDEVVKLKTR